MAETSESAVIVQDVERAALSMLAAGFPLRQAEELFRDKIISTAVQICDGNLCRVARMLQVHRNTVNRVTAELGGVVAAARKNQARTSRARSMVRQFEGRQRRAKGAGA
jgi:DNA-binding NtrC family response regulator